MEFNKEKYKIYNWKNWMMLHWILNPGLAINELILGQRIPKVTLEDKTINKSKSERTFVPCPHCDTLHDARIWSAQNGTAYKNWFGLYCKQCRAIIPCLTNGLSFLILAVTFPIWGWFRKSLKAKWLKMQTARYENIKIDFVPEAYDNKGWIKQGLIWGGFMFIVMSIVFPYFEGQTITLKRLVLGLVIWTFGGLGYGYAMKLFISRSVNRKIKNKADKNLERDKLEGF